MAFVNPDNSLVLVLHNDENRDRNVSINAGTKNIDVFLKADSFNTLIIK
jgi:glucosylceramidase